MDSGLSSWFEVEGNETEYYGYVDSIIRLSFDSLETVFFKGEFWDSIIRHHGPNATVLVDECRLPRVKTTVVLSDEKPEDEPFVFPKDVTQVFYVDYPINEGWKVIVKVDPRSNLVVYKRFGEKGGGPLEQETSESRGSGENSVEFVDVESAILRLRQRELVAIEANDYPGAGVDRGGGFVILDVGTDDDGDFYSEDDDEAE